MILPKFELSEASQYIYENYITFRSVKRREVLRVFSKMTWPNGVIVQREIDYEVRALVLFITEGDSGRE